MERTLNAEFGVRDAESEKMDSEIERRGDGAMGKTLKCRVRSI